MIKISELFASVQGEGLYVGVPSIFMRTFGCNFTCGGFSMPRGEKSQERLNVDPDKFSKFEDLPLVNTGCDSYASWDPRFKKLSPVLKNEEIVRQIKDMLPDQRFSKNFHFIITGGEPLLGWQKQYVELLQMLILRHNLTHLTFETNGTQKLHPLLEDFLASSNLEVTFSISAKLPCSGETWEDAIKPDVVSGYLDMENSKTSYFKFVVANEQDVNDAREAVAEYLREGIDIPVYLMPAGGTDIHYDGNRVKVADICRQIGFRYSPRLQLDLYGNQWAT